MLTLLVTATRGFSQTVGHPKPHTHPNFVRADYQVVFSSFLIQRTNKIKIVIFHFTDPKYLHPLTWQKINTLDCAIPVYQKRQFFFIITF